jgi:hypothetical protein
MQEAAACEGSAVGWVSCGPELVVSWWLQGGWAPAWLLALASAV